MATGALDPSQRIQTAIEFDSAASSESRRISNSLLRSHAEQHTGGHTSGVGGADEVARALREEVRRLKAELSQAENAQVLTSGK